MDVPKILTRNVDDCSLIFNKLAGPDQFDSTTIKKEFKSFELPSEEELSVKNIKIGIPKEYHCPGLSAEVFETWMKVADLLENGGAQVKQVSCRILYYRYLSIQF